LALAEPAPPPLRAARLNEQMTAPATLFALAQSAVSNHTESHYSHAIHIDPKLGVYDTDCSGFVDYLLTETAPEAYGLIPTEPGHLRPRAFMLEQFFAQLAAGVPAAGWTAVVTTDTYQPGDILAWQVPVEENKDTGHCMVVAGTPTQLNDGAVSVPVIDSSELRHYSDSRARGTNGIGSGSIHLLVNANRKPVAFQFDVGEMFHTAPISAGRLSG
jgi:hypothetical protein